MKRGRGLYVNEEDWEKAQAVEEMNARLDEPIKAVETRRPELEEALEEAELVEALEALARSIEEIKALNARLAEAIKELQAQSLEREARTGGYVFDEEKHNRDIAAWYPIEDQEQQ